MEIMRPPVFVEPDLNGRDTVVSSHRRTGHFFHGGGGAGNHLPKKLTVTPKEH